MLRILPLEEAQNFITRKAVRLAEAEQMVAPILEAVRQRGDEAVLEYARKFDGLEGDSFTVPESEWRGAEAQVSDRISHRHRDRVANNIREYAQLQLPAESWVQFARWPAARACRPPARVDGRLHSRRPLSSALDAADDRDPGAGGGREDHLRYVAATQLRRSCSRPATSTSRIVFRIGGAQAIAALAFGTATIPESRSHRRPRQHLRRGCEETSGG